MRKKPQDLLGSTAQLEQDNEGKSVASALVDFGTASRAAAAIEEFKARKVTRAELKEAPALVAIEYERQSLADPPHGSIAHVIVKYEGVLLPAKKARSVFGYEPDLFEITKLGPDRYGYKCKDCGWVCEAKNHAEVAPHPCSPSDSS